MTTRNFSGSAECQPPERSVEDAPEALRVEFIEVAFSMAERAEGRGEEPTPDDLYITITQMLGIANPAEPEDGLRRATQRYIQAAPWPRFYDIVLRLREMFRLSERQRYRDAINSILAGHGIVWQMTERGKLERVLPAPAAEGVQAAFEELGKAEFAAARQLFDTARDAFHAVPRRGRDAAANAFDAMESTAKIRLNLPNATFGDVLKSVRRGDKISPDVREVLDRINTLRNHHLGHGMTKPFTLRADEVDFVYVTCAAAIRMFARL